MALTKVKQLLPGSEGQVVKTVGGVTAWAAESSGGVASVGTPAISKMEAISLAGPASYVNGTGFNATFGNLTTVHRAIIALVTFASTRYLAEIFSKSTNQVNIRVYRATPAHTHTFTPTAHTHTLTMNAHTHTLTMNAHTHTFTGTVHGHSLVATANSTGTLAAAMATAGFHIPTGNPTRTVPAGSASGVGNTTAGGTNANTTDTGTIANTTSTGTIANASATGTIGSTNTEGLEEVANGLNLSGATFELLGFGV